MDDMELTYLKILAGQYPTIASVSTEIINLQSIMNLPKGTEHFLSDIHGEIRCVVGARPSRAAVIRDGDLSPAARRFRDFALPKLRRYFEKIDLQNTAPSV